MIICDTREKANQAILNYFRAHAIPYIEQKLETGDYMDSEMMDTTIDRKQNLEELMKNMCSKDKGRFWREIRRANKEGLRFIVLCEHGDGFKEIRDVARYKCGHSKISGKELMERMYAAHIAYGVVFMFCDKKETGMKIAEILKYT